LTCAYGAVDEGRVRALLASGGEPEALPPGTPSDPDAVAAWLADGAHRPQREGAGVHLMMLDRTADRIVGSISLFHADWEVRAAEVGYGVRGDERARGTRPRHSRRSPGGRSPRAASSGRG
jgi:RimJ/RimL family protein N-acetyltransferase